MGAVTGSARETALTIIFRYLIRQIMISMIAVSTILLMVFMSGRFLKYLGNAAEGEISAGVLFSVMAYRFPGFLELILPLGLFIGILLAYGRMYLESEMTVLLACGVSEGDILRQTLIGSLPVMLVVAAMSLYVSPWGMKQVEEIFNKQRKATEFELLAPGRFQDFTSGGRVTYTEGLSDDKRELQGVFIAEFGKNGEGLTIITASLPFIVPVVTLLAVRLSRVNPRQGRFFHLLPAMLVYITYLGLLIVARDALADGAVPEWIGMFWVHGLFLALGLWLQFGPAWLRKRRLQRAELAGPAHA